MIHGRQNTYQNYGCRCAACTEAQRVAMAAFRASNPEVYQHGYSAYVNQGCRCEVCTEANKAACRAYRLSRKAVTS